MRAPSVTRQPRRWPALVGAFLITAAAAVSMAACGHASTATTSTAPTPIAGTNHEQFVSTLPVGGSRFFSFSIAASGTVTATLQSIGGPGVPPSVVVNMGIGSPYQNTCSANQSAVQVTGEAGLTAVVTGSQQPGVLCVIVADVGNLFAPATFSVAIDHP